MTDRHQPTPATPTPPVASSTGLSEPKGELSPSTVSGNAAGLALPTTATPLAPGPIFSASDFERALEALDLVLQNFAWEKGDNKLTVSSLFQHFIGERNHAGFGQGPLRLAYRAQDFSALVADLSCRL